MPDQLLLVCVGNSRTRFAMVRNGELEPSRVETNTDAARRWPRLSVRTARMGEEGDGTSGGAGEKPNTPVLMASVNRPVSDALEQALRRSGRHVSRLGAVAGEGQLPIPIEHALENGSSGSVGADRLLDALGAFSRARAACVVVDAGTAITVDFVDGDGCFQGGAIAPGVRMMLEALHEKTAALPLVTLTPEVLPVQPRTPEEEKNPPFGKSTEPAIALGVVSAARGLVHLLIDRYAAFYEAYPRVIATGGDAAMLFENDELVEHIVPDLPLIGMLEAYRRLEQLDGDEHDQPSAQQ